MTNLGTMGARILPATVVGLILLFLAFPILVVTSVSFSSATYLTFPPPAFGLKWYDAYFSSADWLRPTWLSLWVAAAVVVAGDPARHAGSPWHRPSAACRLGSWRRASCCRR